MTTPDASAIEQFRIAMEQFWHPVIRSQDLGDKPERITILDQDITVVRLDGEIAAFPDVCRHLGAALSLGDVTDGGKALRCRYHGWSYDKSGRCIDIPLRASEKIPAQARVRKYHSQERYGLVWVCLAEEPVGDLPPYDEFDDDRYYKNEILQHDEWAASAPRLVMAALDDTHFSWVHPGSLGVAGQPRMPERVGDVPVRVEDNILYSDYRTRLPAGPLAHEGAEVGEDETIEVEFNNVSTISSTKNIVKSAIGDSVTWNVYLPVSYNRTLTFTQLARTYDKDPANDAAIEEFNLGVKLEDKEIVESQKPWLLPPLRAQMILYVRPEDVPLVEFQKMAERLGVPQV
ncbi:Rieske 2Fe-2S domain-containing protein [Aeromicrobium sp. P5_D10]